MYLRNVFTNDIFNIYVKTGFGIKQPTNGWYARKSNQTKPKHFIDIDIKCRIEFSY